MKRPRWLKRGASVTFDELIDFAIAHGAPNRKIVSIELGGIKSPYPVIRIVGYEENEYGSAFIGADGDIARWERTTALRYLP